MARYWILVLVALVILITGCWGVFAYTQLWESGFYEVYSDNVRAPVFSGFLTLGSFLLALKSNILARLKEGYDSHGYRVRYLYHRGQAQRNGKPPPPYYDSLRNLASALAGTVCCSYLAAASQMTLGFVRNKLAMAFVCGFALTTLLVAMFLAVEMFRAHAVWFDKIEEDKERELKADDTCATDGGSDVAKAESAGIKRSPRKGKGKNGPES